MSREGCLAAVGRGVGDALSQPAVPTLSRRCHKATRE